MFPILFTIGNFPVSSFGLLLGLGIFFGSFTVWRIARSFDFDVEKVLDLIFLVIGIGFVFSRAVFVLMNLQSFDSLTKILLINRFPGLSFWGGLIGGLLALWWLSKKNRIPFLHSGDMAMIGFFIAAFFAEIGCLLGACGVGTETTSVFSVDQAGYIGKRLPVQLFEALAFLLIFFAFWKKILRFHIQGSFLARGLIFLGIIKFVAGFFKSPGQTFNINNFSISQDLILSCLILLIGIYFHYKIHKKTPLNDLAIFFKFFASRQRQKSLMTKLIRGWYNQKANFTIGLSRGRKRLFKSLNIRSNPDNFGNK